MIDVACDVQRPPLARLFLSGAAIRYSRRWWMWLTAAAGARRRTTARPRQGGAQGRSGLSAYGTIVRQCGLTRRAME